MTVHRIKDGGKVKYVDDDAGDAHSNPMFACDVLGEKGDECRPVVNWMAFDPRYGPDSQQQIEWHIANGTPGAEDWSVGVPC